MLQHCLRAGAALALLATPLAMAKVSQEEADRLGVEGDLTPSGAIWNGNEDGSIPVWTGSANYTDEQRALTYEKLKKLRENPEELEKQLGERSGPPILTITAQNYQQYADKLTEGNKQLFEKYGASYKMNVYETVRTHFNHPEIDKATKKNATNATLKGSDDIRGHELGYPFPIPQKGAEIIWNHKLKYRGSAVRRYNNQAIVAADGNFTVTKIIEDVLFGYANLDIPAGDKERDLLAYYLQETKDPPRLAGRLLLVHETANPSQGGRLAWIFDPGQGRVNRAPKVGYDNPSLSTDGEQFNDQVDMYNGAQDRYDWKLVGKKEMYIPYSSYQILSPRYKYSDIIRVGHVNPDIPRYELHRVWVVEATLRPGMTHQLAKRVFYVDEDSWSIAAVDGYDKQGEYWKFQEAHLATLPMVPVTTGQPEAIHDLKTGRYFLTALSNEEKLSDFDIELKRSEFKPSALRRKIR